jgi:hypothetical protein
LLLGGSQRGQPQRQGHCNQNAGKFHVHLS